MSELKQQPKMHLDSRDYVPLKFAKAQERKIEDLIQIIVDSDPLLKLVMVGSDKETK